MSNSIATPSAVPCMADQGSTIRIKADEQRTTALTVRCPAWCVGHEDAPQYRTDISHVGPDEPLTLPTRRGPVTHLVTALEIRPYSDDPFVQSVFVNVGIGGDWYPTGLAGLEAMADQLEAHAEVLRDRARRLAVLLGGDQ